MDTKDITLASMGPRRLSRGNALARGLFDDINRGFNGAAAFEPRKPKK